MKKILITGAGSYIGTSFEKYLKQWPEAYCVKVLETRGFTPTAEVFQEYDVVFNVAGIAHIKETPKNRELYYKVNRDLCIRIAECAKEAGVKQFILLSSMSVYGQVTGRIVKPTSTAPNNAYGDSKAQADAAIAKLEDGNFIFSCLRPPMVYGQGCKGNYQSLRKFALTSPVFPKIDNERSMIYIGNLCVFIKQVIDENRSGIFHPENADYVNTSEMVRMIALNHGKRIRIVPGFGRLLSNMKGQLFKKVFGSLTYDQTDSVDASGFVETISLTENDLSVSGKRSERKS